MSNSQIPAQADPKAIADAQAMWANFTRAGQFAVIGVTILLGIMALTLTP